VRTSPNLSPELDVAAARKARPRAEVLMRVVQPVAGLMIRVLAPLRVDPQAIVLTHGGVGVAAAFLIAFGGPGAWLGAAALLQVRTLLDNVDGGLARATGRVTRMGRYLDSVLDLVVNALLFAALAVLAPGPWAWPLAALAFVVLMLVLSLDYNLERRYKELRGLGGGGSDDDPIGAPPALYALVKRAYDVVLAPQDALVARLDDALFDRARRGCPSLVEPDLEHRLAWSDLFSSGTLVNLGLSTQMLALGVCLAVGAPFAYVWIVLAQGVYVVVVQALRIARFARYCREA
jgi:archaetidylinositol phosphate synthase